jgi:hypothetical protein
MCGPSLLLFLFLFPRQMAGMKYVESFQNVNSHFI